MRRANVTCIACAALIGALVVPLASSPAAGATFVPRIVNTEGDLEIDASSQTNQYTQGNTTTTFNGRFMSERVDLFADGYVYHPRFEIFLARLIPAMNQSSIATDGSTYRTSKGTMDYEFRTTFLPEHPYNLELYALHHESPGPGVSWRGQTMPMNEYGALFNYKSNPYFFSATYDDLTLESPLYRTDTVSYRANGSYAGKVLSHQAAYTHSDSLSSQDLHVTREAYGYGNMARLADVRLDSRVDRVTSEQQQWPRPSYETDLFTWTEQLVAPLPLNFRLEINYRYMDETDRTGEDAASGLPATEVFNRSTGTSLNLGHQLYRSLTSNLSMNNTAVTSSSGDIDSRSLMFGSTYTKTIPSGMMSAGIQFGRTETDRQGNPVVLSEAHAAPLLGSFVLNQQNVILSTLVVQVKDAPTNSWMVLPPGNYAITFLGLTIQITVLDVSPAALQPPAYVYDFRASYALQNQSKIDTTFEGFSLRLKMWDGLLSPYYSFFRSDQEMVVGLMPGGTDQYTNETAGLGTQAGPLSAFVERQRYRSRLNPSETWRTQVQYRSAVGDDTNVSLLASYLQVDHLASSSVPPSIPFRESTAGTEAVLDMKFPHTNMNFLMNASYYSTNSVIDSTTMIMNASVIWRIGLLSVNGGAQLYRLESLPATGRVAYVTEYYYVTIHRKLF
jgi:hypothetical protein